MPAILLISTIRGMRAPPPTSIIMRPEISFTLPGILLTVREKSKEKDFQNSNLTEKYK